MLSFELHRIQAYVPAYKVGRTFGQPIDTSLLHQLYDEQKVSVIQRMIPAALGLDISNLTIPNTVRDAMRLVV